MLIEDVQSMISIKSSVIQHWHYPKFLLFQGVYIVLCY